MSKAKNTEIEYADALPNSGVTAGRIDGPGMRFACGCEVTPYRISHCEFSRPANTRDPLFAALLDRYERHLAYHSPDGVCVCGDWADAKAALAAYRAHAAPPTVGRAHQAAAEGDPLGANGPTAAALRAPAPPTPQPHES